MANAGERGMQRMVRALGRAFFRAGESQPIPVKALRRILVVRTDDRVGNVLLTTPLLRALREGLPHVRLDLLVAARRAKLVEGCFLADRLVPYDKRHSARNPFAFAALVSRLRAAEYDLAIDAAHYDAFSTTAASLVRLSKARFRIGHDRGDAAHYYTHPVPVPESTRYDVAVKLSLLEPLGLPSKGYFLETSAGLDDASTAAAAKMLRDANLSDSRFVLVNPGARKLDRRVDPQRLAKVIARIARSTGAKSLVVWGPGEQELAEEVVSLAPDAARLAPATDLDELAALLRRASLVVTNDTGPMHLAVACEAPVLALFTQADSARWGHPIPTFHAIDEADRRADLEAEAEAQARRLIR